MRKWLSEEFNSTSSIGVIGAGHVAKEFHLPILHNMSDASISYIADIKVERAEQLAGYYSCTAVEIDDIQSLPRCDAALLAIPVGFRSEYLAEFGKQSTPIFSEKPFATDVDMHQWNVEVTDLIMCNYMRTLFAPVRQARQIIRSDLFGQLRRVEIFEEKIGATGKEKNHYQTDPTKGGGMLLETGVHPLSQLIYILSDWTWSIESTNIIWEGGIDVDVRSKIQFRKGTKEVDSVFRLSRIKPVGTRAELIFDDCKLTFDPGSAGEKISITPRNSSFPQESLSLIDRCPKSMIQAIYIRWKQFLHLLNGGSAEGIEIITGEEVTRLVEVMYNKGES